jgi:hypothetical protein
MLESENPNLPPAKCAWTVHPVFTVPGAVPNAVNVPSLLVITDDILPAPVPENVIVSPPIPKLPIIDVDVSLPVTVTFVPHGTLAIGFNVRAVEPFTTGTTPLLIVRRPATVVRVGDLVEVVGPTAAAAE